MKPITRRCVVAGCTNPARHARCTEHVRALRTPALHRFVYKTAAWAKLRAQVLAEEPTCRRCDAPSAHVDHIVPLRAGGAPFDRANTAALCHSDHSRKTLEERRGLA